GGITVLFYALYFGMLGRDFVDRLSDRMALLMGYYTRTGLPKKHLRSNVCAICGETTVISSGRLSASRDNDGSGRGEHSVVRMNCGHPFHEDCIR
ncbi:hypothetical protein HDU83_006113, partial [Entophlyctis luteolus]